LKSIYDRKKGGKKEGRKGGRNEGKETGSVSYNYMLIKQLNKSQD